MAKKIYYYLGSVMVFVMFCITPCLAGIEEGFKITVINEAGKAYKNVTLVISAVGFDGAYGKILLGEIGTEKTQMVFDYKYEYLRVPLTDMGMPPTLENCNLNLFIVAGPKDPWGIILKRTFENIVKYPKLVYEDKHQQKYHGCPLMQGIRVPDITIIIKGKTEQGIEAKFDGEEYADDANE